MVDNEETKASFKSKRRLKFELFQEQERLSRLSATSGQEMVVIRSNKLVEEGPNSNPMHGSMSNLPLQSHAEPNTDDFLSIQVVNNNLPDMHIMNELDEDADADALVELMQMDTLTGIE